MEAGIYWLIGILIVLFVLSIMAVAEAIKAIAKEGKSKAPQA